MGVDGTRTWQQSSASYSCYCGPNSSATVAGGSPNKVRQAASLSVVQAPAAAGQEGPLVFRLTDASGAPITDYETIHTARMHLFTINDRGRVEDLGDFQHLHPEYAGDGAWRLPTFSFHQSGTTHLVANFISGGVNTSAQTSIDVGVGASTPQKDQSGGYTAQVVGVTQGPTGPLVQFTVRDASGAVVNQVSPIFDAWSHLIMFQPAASAGGPVGFTHGHSMAQAQGGVLTVDMGSLSPGRWTGYLQLAGPDGTPRSIPVTVDAPG